MTRSVAIIGTRGYPSYYGGFETAVRRIAPYLADQGWNVTVYGRKGAVRLDDPLLDPRVQRIETFGINSTSLSTLTFGLSAVLHAIRSKPDVALVMNVANGFWLPLLRLRGIPVVVNVDGIEWERAKWGRLAKQVFRWGAALTATFATELIADAEAIAARWDKEYHRSAHFIPYGGDVPPQLPVEVGFNHRGYILFVARLVPENTVAEFFDAVEILAERYSVVIVGSSGYATVLDDMAASLAARYENVQWFGHVSDDRKLHGLWQHAGAYFHGHSVGGTNPALVQAMACGAPTVARDTVYNREVLADVAQFVQPTSGAIADALISVMENAPEIDVSRMVERAKSNYSWELVCAGYERNLRAHVRTKDIELRSDLLVEDANHRAKEDRSSHK